MRLARLCPWCASDYQTPGGDGLCIACSEERTRELYVQDDHRRTEAQRAFWRDRQRRHRDKERYRPFEPLDADADLFDLLEENLSRIESLSRHVSTPGAQATLDAITEFMRALVWGPEDE